MNDKTTSAISDWPSTPKGYIRVPSKEYLEDSCPRSVSIYSTRRIPISFVLQKIS